jgi:hypothetical protein
LDYDKRKLHVVLGTDPNSVVLDALAIGCDTWLVGERSLADDTLVHLIALNGLPRRGGQRSKAGRDEDR